MKSLALALTVVLLSFQAKANLKFSFQNEDLAKVIDIYSKATGQKFVLDPGLHGKVSIDGADDVTSEEAFNLLSTSLAANNFAISKHDDIYVVLPVRTVARDFHETYTTLPSQKPERYVTYILQLKSASADDVNKNFRFLASKDGELMADTRTNSLVISDWTSNIQRIDQILKSIDKQVDPKVAKLVTAAQAEREKRKPKEMFPNNARGAKTQAPSASSALAGEEQPAPQGQKQ